ncbi:MAG: hypothetical protein JO164_02685 [Candidatus Eremiobacteraeota bacterium]|nr:hypothetical protein [Candidatus Eremiobacteraeota bacterium]
MGEGPIILRGDGTYQLAVNRSTRNGLAESLDNYSSALSMTAERRTEQTSISVSNAFGYGAGSFAAGSFIVAYRTPKYGLTYGQVTGPSESQLGIGGFARGISLAIPVRNGDVSYLASTAAQSDGTTYRYYGVQRNWNAFGGFLSAGQYYGNAERAPGRLSVTDIGYRRFGAKLSTDTELAISTPHLVGGAPSGTKLATAFHADLQGKDTFATLGLQFDPAGFQTLTSTMQGGFSADLAVRRHSATFGDVGVDFGHTDSRINNDVEHDDRVTLTGGHTWAHVGVQFTSGLDRQRTTGSDTLQRTSGITFTESLKKLSLFETYQATSSDSSLGFARQNQLALGVARPIFGGSVAYQFTHSMQSGDGSTGTGTAQIASYRRAIGKKLDAQISESLQTSFNNSVPTKIQETTVTLVRRLSSVVAVQVGAGAFHQTGPGGGSGTEFTASLVGPFGFGQPRTGGRANPNLPAVIRGIVTYSATSNPFAYNAPTLKGYNNALIILDGRITQRTDSSGQFEFRFVSQGTHTLRIDPATIQPGLITDREYQAVTVLGGQTTSVEFNVGNFAGVTGSVVVADANGQKHGLPNVGVAVDGVQAVTTTPDGHFSVGRLNPGPHTVEVVEATLPSTVAFTGDKKKTVTVTPGTLTPLLFTASTLGSIAGNVLAPSEGGFGPLAGLKNAYVVAEPGEHAGITDDDGSFLLDNMPPGTYTLTVDPETVPEGLEVISGPEGPVVLEGGASLSGIIFKLSAAAKQVVYTFEDGKRQSIQVATDPAAVPPGAVLRITARSNAPDLKALYVESDVFGAFALRFDKRLSAWGGAVVVPQLAKGDYSLTVTAHRKGIADGTALVPVDPRIPLFSWRLSPRNPQPGHTVRVTLKALANVDEGDAVQFEDGYKVLLPKPNGHVFGFDIRLWQKGLPYNATILTKHAQSYPLSLR